MGFWDWYLRYLSIYFYMKVHKWNMCLEIDKLFMPLFSCLNPPTPTHHVTSNSECTSILITWPKVTNLSKLGSLLQPAELVIISLIYLSTNILLICTDLEVFHTHHLSLATVKLLNSAKKIKCMYWLCFTRLSKLQMKRRLCE